MGNGQMHQMSEPPHRATADDQQRAEMDQAQPIEQPPPSSSAPEPASTSLSVTPAPRATADAADRSVAPAAAAVESSSDVAVDEPSINAESPSDARLTPPPPPSSALLPSLTPRGRALPAIVRPSLSSSLSKTASPVQAPSPVAASLSSPLPPPSPSAASFSSSPSTAARSLGAVSLSLSSAPSTSTAAQAATLTTTPLSPPLATTVLAAPALPGLPATPASSATAVLSPVASPSARPSWQLDNNEHRTLICRFCGGPQCKHEDYTRQPNYRTAAAIVGLNSSHITPALIAMQRPSTHLIHTHSIAAQFAQLGVTAIINLQQTGEHALCGPGIQPHGFSYSPDDLPGTHHYNFGWVDMGTPPIERMLNIVQVMAMHELRGGRLAVHCHAGYGRTGMVIACYLVFAHHYSAEMAITTVRQQREGSVQTKEQKRFCYRFEQYIKHLRYHYHITPASAPTTQLSTTPAMLNKPAALPPLSPNPTPTQIQPFQPLSPTPALPPSLSYPLQPPTLPSLLTSQRLFLHGAERQQYRYASKLVCVLVAAIEGCGYERLCEEIEARAVPVGEDAGGGLAGATGVGGGAGDVGASQRGSFLLHLPFDCGASWTLEDSSTLEKIKHGANLNDYTAVKTATPFILLVALLHFLASLSAPLLPFYTSHGPALPTSLSTAFPALHRTTIPTLHTLLRLLHALQSTALPRSSDARPVATLLVLAFAFALLHPSCAAPGSLALLVGGGVGRGGVDGASAEDEEGEEGASLGAMLCFMSVLLTEWHEEHSEWVKREEDDGLSTRVGVRKGERWWMGQEALSPSQAKTAITAGVASADGAVVTQVKMPRVSKPNSRRSSGKRSARGSGSKRGSRMQAMNAAESDKLAVPESVQMMADLSTDKDASKEGEEERKEQPTSAEPAVAVVPLPLPTPRLSKRGSGTRPMLPPLTITRNLST